MKNTLFLIAVMVCFGNAAIAQTPMPEIPEREQCDSMAKKSGGLVDRYGSRKFYLGCFVAESVPTLLLEASGQTDAAKESFSKSTEGIPVEDFVATLRKAEAQANIGLYAAEYSRKYLTMFLGTGTKFEYPDTRESHLELAENLIAQSNLVNKMIAHQYAKLRESHPSVELARMKSRLVTLKYCEMYKNRYETGKMTEVERSFLFPQSYQDKVYTCAGVGVNFYDLLHSSRISIRANQYAQYICLKSGRSLDECLDD